MNGNPAASMRVTSVEPSGPVCENVSAFAIVMA